MADQEKEQASSTGALTAAAHRQVETIVTRLRELRRKCESFAARSDEFFHMGERLDQIISKLEQGLEPGAEPIPFRSLAQQLVAVERLFETTGFMNVARIVSSIEQALDELAPQPVHAEPAPAAPEETGPQAFTSEELPAGNQEPGPAQTTAEGQDKAAVTPRLPMLWLYAPSGLCLVWLLGRRLLALPVVTATVASLLGGLAFGLLVSWVHRHTRPLFAMGRDQRALAIIITVLLLVPSALAGLTSAVLIALGLDTPVVEQQLCSSPAVPATTTGTTAAAPLPDEELPVPLVLDEVVLARVPVEIELADAALHDGNLLKARKHLTIAAAIDPHHRLVVDMAETLVTALLVAADDAAREAEWEEAAARIREARGLTSRFYLDTDELEQTEQRHNAMARYHDVSPADASAVQAAIGSFMIITLSSKEEITGRLISFDGTELLVDVRSGVSGGLVRFEKKVPLTAVSELRIWPRADQPR